MLRVVASKTRCCIFKEVGGGGAEELVRSNSHHGTRCLRTPRLAKFKLAWFENYY